MKLTKKDFKVILDKENNKSVFFIIDNEITFWDEIGGHSLGTKEYLKECKIIKDNNYLDNYFKLYNYKF